MAKENYKFCLEQVLKYEGGFSDHKDDPGGATMKGITQRVYDDWRKRNGKPSQSVRNISQQEVEAIYRREYWDRVRGDDLPSGLDMAVFDFAVNSGVKRASTFLQKIVGVAQDGIIGPATISAARTYIAKKLTDDRLTFMRRLSTWQTFGSGWSHRINDVRRQIETLCK